MPSTCLAALVGSGFRIYVRLVIVLSGVGGHQLAQAALRCVIILY